ncbi:MAG: sigma-70 family RNA polymerase sigma factor [Dehalococcoidia bacterium]
MSTPRNPDASATRILESGAILDGAMSAGDRERWPDEVLMHAIMAGDRTAFTAIYDRYVDLVYSTCLRVLADPGAAEDATQDVFVRLWRKPESFVPERGRLLSWLVSVARNRAVDELRARGRRRRREDVESAEEVFAVVATSDAGPEAAAQVHEEQRLVRRALVDLPPDQRRALELAYFGGLTQQEIAVRLHEPLGTVKTRIRLGMQKLRRSLQGKV